VGDSVAAILTWAFESEWYEGPRIANAVRGLCVREGDFARAHARDRGTSVSWMERLSREQLDAAVGGDAAAVKCVVTHLGPIVRTAVVRVLYRYRSRARGRNLVQEAEDLTQEALIVLFEDGARVLRSFSHERGATLETFVRVVAERTALSILRSGKRSPFSEDPTEDIFLAEATTEAPDPEAFAVSRDSLLRLHDRLKETLSPRGYLLFHRIFVDEVDVDTVAGEFALGRDAVYAWKHRFGKSVRACLHDIDQMGDSRKEQMP
jgi:RNA polymerase sigma factor (sigma-70 family)